MPASFQKALLSLTVQGSSPPAKRCRLPCSALPSQAPLCSLLQAAGDPSQAHESNAQRSWMGRGCLKLRANQGISWDMAQPALARLRAPTQSCGSLRKVFLQKTEILTPSHTGASLYCFPGTPHPRPLPGLDSGCGDQPGQRRPGLLVLPSPEPNRT